MKLRADAMTTIKRVTTAHRDVLTVGATDGSGYTVSYNPRQSTAANLERAIAEQRAYIAEQQRKLAALEAALATLED